VCVKEAWALRLDLKSLSAKIIPMAIITRLMLRLDLKSLSAKM
tara:strand:+ start:713 stop:841 length:129 start_codon:yes stop_codon:yes gene_type:complete